MWNNRVLVVDDDPDVVIYLTSFLEDNGYEARGAGDSTRAIAALDGFRPDAILLDVLMPGRSGLDLLVTLRRDPRWTDICMVVITGLDQILQDDCQSYLGSQHGIRGPDALLAKPVDPQVLLTILRKLERDNSCGDRG
ncbi:MAG: response regulator [Acidobacteriota bacterium]